MFDALQRMVTSFAAREWEEVVAILPLFEVFKRISNRLKEIENVDLQAHSGA